jgi:ribosome biogenesis GTPase
MSPETVPEHKPVGRMRKYHSDFYYVESEGVLYECKLRGLIKKEGAEVLVGDMVELDTVDPANRTARIYGVLERRNAISRPKMANVDQVFIVYSMRDPDFDPLQMDRYLTHIELAGITPLLIISKSDLADSEAAKDAIRQLYAERLGLRVLFSSVHDADSLEPVRELTKDKMTVLAGPSGAGKSSLLNALNPELQLRVGEVSDKIGRGQHTTRHVELLALTSQERDTLIADTPGFSNLRFNYVMPAQIEAIYRDFAPYRAGCAFSDCLHIDEEGCAVRDHLDEIPESRYRSYLSLVGEARLYKEETQSSSQKQEYGYKQVSTKGRDAVRILRLKEKNRDLSRRAMKQQVSLMDGEEEGPPENELDLDES